MTIHTYQSPDWTTIRTARLKALEAVAKAASGEGLMSFDVDCTCTYCSIARRLFIAQAALKETDDEPNKS